MPVDLDEELAAGRALQVEVLDWMKEKGRGYKAAAAHFGIPRSTIQEWAIARRDDRDLPPPGPETLSRARGRPRARGVEEPDADHEEGPAGAGTGLEMLERLSAAGVVLDDGDGLIPADDPDLEAFRQEAWDPGSCGREEYLERAIRRCFAGQLHAIRQRHGGVARQWEAEAAGRRRELDALRDQQRREREAAGRAADPDPTDVARRIMRQLPALVRLVGRAVALDLHGELGRVLGLVEVDVDPSGDDDADDAAEA